MKVIQYTPVNNPDADIENIVNDKFVKQKPLSPFHETSVNFLSALSKEILEYPGVKVFPELVALAFWLRKANLSSIISPFNNKIDNSEVVVPRGVAFHIAPSNVDSIFLYSWALSLLVGNLNVVRVSQTLNEQLEILLSILRDLLHQKEWTEIKDRNIIFTYPRDEKINIYLSNRADVRILWGGDETIKSIRVLPSKPATKDILFADKFSYTAVDASMYSSLPDDKKIQLARNFYNDAYWFDQMACSSPRFVLFVGSEKECEASSKAYWKFLEDELMQKGKPDTLDIAMEKLVYMYESISRTELPTLPAELNSNKPTVLRVAKNEITKFRETCGGGFFFECFLNNLDELTGMVSRKDQTLGYYGFSKDELKQFASKVNGAGIDRIVPIGQALNFAPTWDGYSLLNELSKRVSVL